MPPSLAEHLPTIIDCKSWDSLFTLGCLYEWQSFWAGVLAFAAGLMGFLAAIWAVRRTLQSEQRKAHRELDALKKGLGAEARHFAAYNGAAALKTQLASGQQIKIIDVENATQFPSPTLYKGNSSLVGLLGEQTPQVVLFYNQIDIIEAARVRLRKDIDTLLAKTPVAYAMSKQQLEMVVDPLLDACNTAVSFLPALKTGTSLDNNDTVFPEKVTALIEEWQRVKRER
jgi:hypothetical protein